MNRIQALLGFLCVASATFPVSAQVDLTLDDDGRIVLLGQDVDLIGVDLISTGGHLRPIVDSNADPFAFLLSNSSSQITYGILGTGVTLDGKLPLSAYYDLVGNSDYPNDLAASQWGGLGDGNQGPMGFPVLPEPTTATLGLLALGHLAAARRRSRGRDQRTSISYAG